MESGFKRTINWNEYHSKNPSQAQNRCLNALIVPSFQGANSFFVLSFDGDDGWKSYMQYYNPTVEIKDYIAVRDGGNFCDQ